MDAYRERSQDKAEQRIELYHEMIFDCFSPRCTRTDAVTGTPAFAAEYARYCLTLIPSVISAGNILDQELIPSEVIDEHPDVEVEEFEMLERETALPLIQPVVVLSNAPEDEDEVSADSLEVPPATIIGTMKPTENDGLLDPTVDRRSYDGVARMVRIYEERHDLIRMDNSLIAELVYPYADCKTRMAMKLAYPALNVRKFCCSDVKTSTFIMMDPYDLKLSTRSGYVMEKRRGNNKAFVAGAVVKGNPPCVCTTLLFDAVFTQRFNTLVLARLLRRRCVENLTIDQDRINIVGRGFEDNYLFILVGNMIVEYSHLEFAARVRGLHRLRYKTDRIVSVQACSEVRLFCRNPPA